MIDKVQLDKYISGHLSAYSDTNEYRLALVSQTHGVYSGIVSMVKSGKDNKRYLDFILDFTDRSLTISGISGKQLKSTTGLLNEIFNNGDYELAEGLSETSVQTLDTIKYLGMLYGSLGREPISHMNIGRGLLRALHTFPVAESYVKEFSGKMKDLFVEIHKGTWMFESAKSFFSKVMFPHWNLISYYQEEWDKGKHKPLQKVLGISKDTYNRLKKEDLLKDSIEFRYFDLIEYNNYLYDKCDEANECHLRTTVDSYYSFPISFIQKANEVNWNRLEQTLKDVDDERGYHNYKSFYDSMRSNMSRYVAYNSEYPMNSGYPTLSDVANMGNTDIFNLSRYLYASCYHQQAIDFENALEILKDYYKMVADVPHFVKFPRYLKTAHDIASRNAEVLGSSSDILAVHKVYTHNQKLEMNFKDYSMILAASPKEIVDEGQLQHNCVGSYVNDVVNGTSIILFLRKKSDIYRSWVTVEVRDIGGTLKVVQTFATFNDVLNNEQKKALATWMKINKIQLGDSVGGVGRVSNEEFSKLAVKTTNIHKIDMEFHRDSFDKITEQKSKMESAKKELAVNSLKVKKAS